jgi:hypothetical protein
MDADVSSQSSTKCLVLFFFVPPHQDISSPQLPHSVRMPEPDEYK